MEENDVVAREGGPGGLSLDFGDPMFGLPEVARNLLLAAKHIVANQGFEALSLNSIAKASGENKAMVSYYFGGKAGLVAAVLDSVIHDDYLASVSRVRGVGERERVDRIVEEMRGLCDAREEFRVFFELLPIALRDEVLRARMARLYDWYRGEKLEWLGAREGLCDPEDRVVVGLSQLLSAFIDGVALQRALDDDLDLSPAFEILGEMIGTVLPVLGSEPARPVD